jgi:hypothetical protein
MLPDSPAFLWDAREAATKAASVAQSNELAEYLGDWVLQAAVERQLEILGEALKNLALGRRRDSGSDPERSRDHRDAKHPGARLCAGGPAASLGDPD